MVGVNESNPWPSPLRHSRNHTSYLFYKKNQCIGHISFELMCAHRTKVDMLRDGCVVIVVVLDAHVFVLWIVKDMPLENLPQFPIHIQRFMMVSSSKICTQYSVQQNSLGSTLLLASWCLLLALFVVLVVVDYVLHLTLFCLQQPPSS